ncbi:MAG: hypothetical protein V3U75_14000 [Methylococcaceae bacterium]
MNRFDRRVLNEFMMIGSNLSGLLPIAMILFALSNKVEYHARLYRRIGSLITVGLTFTAMIEQQAMAPTLTMHQVYC